MKDENNTNNMEDSIDNLVKAAQEERWEDVDKTIPEICDKPEAVYWATGHGVKNEDGNVRDLAVSILEKSRLPLVDDQITILEQLMNDDDNPYVKFRSSFALFAHGIRNERVMDKLHEAAQDPDVKEIAEGYLNQIEKAN